MTGQDNVKRKFSSRCMLAWQVKVAQHIRCPDLTRTLMVLHRGGRLNVNKTRWDFCRIPFGVNAVQEGWHCLIPGWAKLTLIYGSLSLFSATLYILNLAQDKEGHTTVLYKNIVALEQ